MTPWFDDPMRVLGTENRAASVAPSARLERRTEGQEARVAGWLRS
jgi:hypothetical protein